MEFSLFGILEMLTDSLMMSLLVPITILCAGGGLPYVLERRRRRSLEKALPEVLETISTTLGAGLGLQQAFTDMSRQREDLLGRLLRDAVAKSKATSFDAALSDFALRTRSPMVQRAMNLLQTANANEAPLQQVTFSMSIEYDRLVRLQNKRHADLVGSAVMMQMLMCVLLPAVIGMMYGLFAPASSGIPMTDIHNSVMVYFGFAAAFGVLAGAVMIGRTMTSSLWWIAPWALLGQFTYMATYLSAGQMV